MRVEVLIWLAANTISFAVSSRDLWSTTRVYRWTRANIAKRSEMYFVAKRNFRASLFRFALATSFVSAGVISVTPVPNTSVVWFLVAGAVILTADIVLEARYRGSMFAAAKRQADEDHEDVKKYRAWRRHG